MLTVRDVHKSYGSKGLFRDTTQQVLRGVDMHAAPGAVVGLVGPSGSGKSTLGRLMLGLERPDSGEVLLEGQPVRTWRAGHPGGMSVVFQDYSTSVNPAYSLFACIAEPLLGQRGQLGQSVQRGQLGQSVQRGQLGQHLTRRVHELMERVGLPSALASQHPHEVSGGQLQRACIARAVATSPRFILFDEAISSLDASMQARVLDLLRELKGDMTYVFIAHDLQSVAYFCDDIYFLHEGRVVEHTPPAALAQVTSPCARRLVQSVIVLDSTWTDV